MKRYNIIKTPRFAIDWIDYNTVLNSIFKFSHDFTILNILNNLNALRTDKLEFPAGMNNSTRLIVTMNASNRLKESAAYFFNPNPKVFIINSSKKIYVKNKFATSKRSSSQWGLSYTSIAKKNVFNRIRIIIVLSK
jgi:hypothetical protein